MNILVLGCGSIGSRHARNAAARNSGIITLDADPSRAVALAKEVGGTAVASLEEGLGLKPEAALICTPPHLHVPQAVACVGARVPVFIEKPLAHADTGIEELCRLAEQGRVPTMVACNLRFTEGLRKVQELLPSLGTLEWAEITFGFDLRQWRPGQDYRLNYAARRDQGGGIVLDAIHEIDYAFWLLGKPLSWKSAVSSSGTLEIETEDSADLALALERCADVRIHLDYLNPRYTRTCHVRGINGSLSWEFRSGKVTAEIQGMRTNHETGSDVNAMYVAELDHFLEALRTGRVPMNPVTEAAYTLRMALSFRDGRRG